MIAACFRGSRLLSYGFNCSKKTDPAPWHISRQCGFTGMYDRSECDYISLSLHAEVDAIKKLKGRCADTIIIARKKADGTLGLAKPCKICQEAIRRAGISRVIYTEDD